MPHTEEHANDSSSGASQSLASQYQQGDSASPADQIRGRAYELYIKRGSRPGDSVSDWLEAERDYYARS